MSGSASPACFAGFICRLHAAPFSFPAAPCRTHIHALWCVPLPLQAQTPHLGVVLGCCAKPSHDLGRINYFSTVMESLFDRLRQHGVDTILTACPSCHQMFSSYAAGFTIRSIYEDLRAGGAAIPTKTSENVALHDPCATRFDRLIQKNAREFLKKHGYRVHRPEHCEKKTMCCGEGGAVGFVEQTYRETWVAKRSSEMSHLPLATYCGGCVEILSRHRQVRHILDLAFEPDARPATPPWPSLRHLNRLWLKWKP
jgi:Fe-S oxidoreductase